MARVNLKKQLRIGTFIVSALAVMIVFVFTLGGDTALFEKKIKYHVYFKSTSGLYEGDPVLLTGVEVGNVSHIGFSEDPEEKRIYVELAVSESIQDRIRQDSRARIGSASIVYGKIVELTMGSNELPKILPGGELTANESGVFGDIVDTTNQVIKDLRSVVAKIDHGDGMLSVLLNEPLEIRKTVRNLSSATDRLSIILGRIENGEGPLGSLVSDSSNFDQTIQDLKSATTDLKTITANLKGSKSVMGRLINDAEYGKDITKNLQSTLRSLANISAKIDTGYGTAGQLVNDASVYEGLQNVILGMEKSSMTRWMIQGRRKAGEKERKKQQEINDESQKTNNK